MATTDREDGLLLALRALPRMDVDPRRAKEVCDRAVALLKRGRPGGKRSSAPWRRFRSALEPVLAAALAAGFVAWIVERSMGVLGASGAGIFWP